MNKKFLSAILFGALMVSSTGTFFSHVMRLPVDMNWFSLTVPKLLSRMVLMEQMVLLLSLNSVWKAITGRLAQTKVLLGWM